MNFLLIKKNYRNLTHCYESKNAFVDAKKMNVFKKVLLLIIMSLFSEVINGQVKLEINTFYFGSGLHLHDKYHETYWDDVISTVQTDKITIEFKNETF